MQCLGNMPRGCGGLWLVFEGTLPPLAQSPPIRRLAGFIVLECSGDYRCIG